MARRSKFPVRTPQQQDAVRTLCREGYTILIFAWLNALTSKVLVEELEHQIASGNRVLIFKEINGGRNGKVLKHCSLSHLRKLDVKLPSKVVDALGHDPLPSPIDVAQFHSSNSFSLSGSSPDVSLIQIKDNGSIEVAFPACFPLDGKCTVIDGVNMVRSGFESLNQSPPKPPQTLEELNVVIKTLRHVTGYDWNRIDGMKLLTVAFEGFDKLLLETYRADLDQEVPSTSQSTNATSGCRLFPPKSPKTIAELHHAIENLRIVTGVLDMTDKDALIMLGSPFKGFGQFFPGIFEGIKFPETHIHSSIPGNSSETSIDNDIKIVCDESDETSTFNQDNSVKFSGKFGYLLSCACQILCYVGQNADINTGTGITCFYGVGLPAFESVMTINARDIYWVDYVKAIAYGSSCLSVMISWVFSNRRRNGHIPVTSAKERRQHNVGHVAAGWAFFSMAIGVFSNVFFIIPLPYAVCFICCCTVLLFIVSSRSAPAEL